MANAGPEAVIERYVAGIERANATGLPVVIFIHGLWLLPGSWDRWLGFFEQAGFVAIAPGWPGDPETEIDANAHPEVFAGKSIGQVRDHFAQIIGRLKRKPILVGHSFGGLLAEILAGRGLSLATVAIAPAPFRGVLPLPASALRSSWPVLRNPFNWNKAVPLSFEQFRYAFANAVSDDEARSLFDRYAVPAPGKPIFQAATANLNPWTEARAEVANPERGPMLVVGGERDHTVPWAICMASYNRARRNIGITELRQMPNRGHSITIDGGWEEVATEALRFANRAVNKMEEPVVKLLSAQR